LEGKIMKITTREMILAALFAALTAVGAFIKIPVGPVPITLQILFTILSGILLGSKTGALSQLVYVVTGLIGVPIFASGTVGLSAVLSPSFGYLIGFILASFVIGKIVEGAVAPSFIKLLAATFVGIVVIYAVGVPYLYVIKNVIGKGMPIATALKFGFYVFIPGDLIKCIAAAALGTKVVPAVRKAIA
jgi:biotin transport system substrate-specific component